MRLFLIFVSLFVFSGHAREVLSPAVSQTLMNEFHYLEHQDFKNLDGNQTLNVLMTTLGKVASQHNIDLGIDEEDFGALDNAKMREYANKVIGELAHPIDDFEADEIDRIVLLHFANMIRKTARNSKARQSSNIFPSALVSSVSKVLKELLKPKFTDSQKQVWTFEGEPKSRNTTWHGRVVKEVTQTVSTRKTLKQLIDPETGKLVAYAFVKSK